MGRAKRKAAEKCHGESESVGPVNRFVQTPNGPRRRDVRFAADGLLPLGSRRDRPRDDGAVGVLRVKLFVAILNQDEHADRIVQSAVKAGVTPGDYPARRQVVEWVLRTLVGRGWTLEEIAGASLADLAVLMAAGAAERNQVTKQGTGTAGASPTVDRSQYDGPHSPKDFRKRFGNMSATKFRKLVNSGEIVTEKLTTKSIFVHKDSVDKYTPVDSVK